ncbi:MAG TPA: CoA pyrophosphatase [Geobacteraceae bacterium]
MTFDDITRLLARHHPQILDVPHYTRAAVALILRSADSMMEILFIERAPCAGDPWSGDIGFPGGKMEPGDSDPRRTAERETKEEINLELASCSYLGRLSDIAGAHLPVLVSCFVYGVQDTPPLVPSQEIRDLFWIRLTELTAAERHVTARVRFDGETLERPAIRLPLAGKPVLWGLTYRFVMEFLELLQGESSR